MKVGKRTQKNADAHMVPDGLILPLHKIVLCKSLHEVHETLLAGAVREEDLCACQVNRAFRGWPWQQQITFNGSRKDWTVLIEFGMSHTPLNSWKKTGLGKANKEL